jgi:hypothetical protein
MSRVEIRHHLLLFLIGIICVIVSTASAARIRNRRGRALINDDDDTQGIINLKRKSKDVTPEEASDLEHQIADARKLVAESAVAVEKEKRGVKNDQSELLNVLKEKVQGTSKLHKLKVGHNKTKKSSEMVNDGLENIESMKQAMIKYKEALNKLAALQAKNEALTDTAGDIPAATEKRVIKAHGKPAKLSKRQKLLKNMGLAAYRIALFNTTAQNMTANVSISNIMEQKWRKELSAKKMLETKVDKLQQLMNETLGELRGAEKKKAEEKKAPEDSAVSEEDKESKHDWKSLENKLRERIPEQA